MIAYIKKEILRDGNPSKKGSYLTNFGPTTYFPDTGSWVDNFGICRPIFWLDQNGNWERETEESRLRALINNPELNNFIEGIKIESAHQTERWGLEQEEQNPPHHYSMVMNKLLGKLVVAIWDRDTDKFKHHCITIAAAMHNCHRQIDKKGTVINEWFNKE